MKLVLTLLVRDEIDIIEGMLNFHFAQGIDHMIVTDNGSVDGTLEILKKYEKEGLIDLLLEPPSDFSQHRWVSRMANLAYENHQADWIFHADADELFIKAQNHQNYKEYLRQVPEDISIVEIPRHDFVQFNRPMTKSPHIEMIYRKVVSYNLKGMPLPHKVIHRGSPNTVVVQGNHQVCGDLLKNSAKTDQLSIYHYPIRSYPQFYSKVKNGGSGYARNDTLNKNQGFHKRHWYNLLINNNLIHAYNVDFFHDDEKLAKLLKNKILTTDNTVADFFLELES